MSQPVMREVRASDLENLLDAAQICAEDLSIEIAERYQGRDKYPTLQRRYENDMAPVHRLQACIVAIKVMTD